jgi:hypothetical protein
MRERERSRERDDYGRILEYHSDDRKRSYTGMVVIRGKEQPWKQSRQGLSRRYTMPSCYWGETPVTALDDWNIFIQDIRRHSGMHRHQGGLVIYIIEGAGYSLVNGERHDWEAGDLLLLPMKPGGVEHQHFNKHEGTPARWIAFISAQLFEWGASDFIQVQEHPDYRPPAPQTSGNARASRGY